MAKVIGCEAAKFPLKYLCVPVECNMARYSNWNALIQKISSKLALYKARLLSVSCRLYLIKSVLGNLRTYYMSIYMMPVFVQKKLESICNNFFIGGDKDEEKMTWVRWKKCLASKELGAEHIYGSIGGSMEDTLTLCNSTWMPFISVKHIKHKGISLVSLCVCKIGNGVSRRFWEDTWSGNQPIKLQFPRICLLDNVKDCSIADRLSSQDWCSTLRRHPRGGAEISLVDSNTLDSASTGTRWNRSIPIKVNVFIWRLMLNKLPTMVNLDRKCIDVGTTLCPICEEDVETVNHIFFTCDMALWDLVARWRKGDSVVVHMELSKPFDFSSPPPMKAMLWDSIKFMKHLRTIDSPSPDLVSVHKDEAPGTSPRGFGSSANENNSVRPEELHPKENNMLSVVEPISSTAEEDTPYASILSSQTKTK
ncbi:RNA-directed DNA polymerase, eukaryota, reverse transcriptase zinc-binding domain protein [Tanacetum coccineum]